MENKQPIHLNIEYLPKGVANPQFQQRESGVSHTPYAREQEFYSCIKNGDIDGVSAQMEGFLSSALVVGRMSNDNLRQAQYLAVSCITLATRYAIEGGLIESEAYNLSDRYIQCIDNMKTPEEIIAFLPQKAIELAALVKSHAQRLSYPQSVRSAEKYISAHLHDSLRVSDIAAHCGVSASYLSKLFSDYIGDTVAHYVLAKKLEASKELLSSAYDYGEIGYYFGFCSQTHYIVSFKKEYGMTPREYKLAHTVKE